MIRDFWQYRLLKSGRKAFWLPLARWRAYRDRQRGDDLRSGRTAYGVTMVQRWYDRTFVYCHAGVYGRFLADELERRSEPFAFIDIGANQGLYSLIAARNPACRQVIAFEPVQQTYDVLNRNVALNGLEDRIETVRLAISDTAGSLAISVPEHHSGMATLDGAQHARNSGTQVIEAVDRHGLEGLLGGSLPLVVKVDVEGHELTVFRELLATGQASRIDALFYEVDTRWSNPGALARTLEEAGLESLRKVGFGHHFDVMATRRQVG